MWAGIGGLRESGPLSDPAAAYDVNLRPYQRQQPPVWVGSTRQLLFDDFFLAMAGREQWDQLAYGVRFSLGRVAKHGAPVLEADEPWETGSAWVCVLRENGDGGRYRLWYNSYHADRRGLRVSYAESEDGVHFAKLRVGLVDVGGARDHNVVFAGGFGGVSPELGNVFRDPNAAPGEEYKLVYADWHGAYALDLPWQAGTAANGTLRGASSPDGLRWTRYFENFLGRYPDSQNVACWDPTLGKYVAYHRTHSRFAGLDTGGVRIRPQPRGRAVGRIESDDFRQWSPTEVALAADVDDGLNTDVYNSAYSRHPDNPHAHYLFPSFYRHYEGTFEVQVAISRDNRTWARPCRDTFIPLGAPGEFDCFIISVAPAFVPVDGDTWALYYRSGDGPHGGSHPITLGYQPRSRVSRVTLKRDRVVGIEGRPEGGHCATRPLAFEGSHLVVNAEPTGPDPELRVQLLSAQTHAPIAGYAFEQCRPIRADGLDAPVVWEGSAGIGADVPRAAVRLHFRLRAMRLYAFQFLP